MKKAEKRTQYGSVLFAILAFLALATEGAAQDFEEGNVASELSAAEAGSPEAQFMMGLRYFEGYGVPLDYLEARRWFGLAAEQDHASAQSALGSL